MTPDIINILTAILPTILPTICVLGFLLLHQRQATQEANLTAQRLEHDDRTIAMQQGDKWILVLTEVLEHLLPKIAEYLVESRPTPRASDPKVMSNPKPFDAEEVARGWLAYAASTSEAIAWGNVSRVEQTKLLVACFGARTWDVEALDAMPEQERADLLWYTVHLLLPENAPVPFNQERLARARELARDKIPF